MEDLKYNDTAEEGNITPGMSDGDNALGDAGGEIPVAGNPDGTNALPVLYACDGTIRSEGDVFACAECNGEYHISK